MPKVKSTRYQRFVKAEKNKTKLKNKKELPKGTNVTDTTFKVKKIVIRDKNKESDSGEVSKVSIKETLSKLQHFNTGIRTEALTSLTKYLNSPSSWDSSISFRNILLALIPLVLDKERNVRRESFKVIHGALSPLSTDKIEPFFDILSSYLRCSMTHIDTRIHEDSLQYFDVLLLCTPTLLAKNFYNIIPSFLDMISKLRADSKPGRTLSVNLGSKMTSVKWRSKVLLRLHQFLDVFYNEKKLNCPNFDSKLESSFYNKNIENNFPIYRSVVQTKLSCFYKDKVEQATNDTELDKIKSYIDSLLPLLFETWLEIRPDAVNNSKVESVITVESAELLGYILEIILLLWMIIKLIENEYRNYDLSKWFVDKYRREFSTYFLTHFPYDCNNHSSQRNKSKVGDLKVNCHLQNLMIAHVFIVLNESIVCKFQNKEVVSYIRENVKEVCNGEPKVQKELLACLQEILLLKDFSKSNQIVSLLDTMISTYSLDDLPKTFKQNLFEVLCVILNQDNLSQLQKLDSFSLWLNEITNTLMYSNFIPREIFDIILQFAIRHNVIFNDMLRLHLNKILENLPKIRLNSDNENAMRRKVISLIYWIKCWNNNSLNIIQDQLSANLYSSDNKEFLVDILKVKLEGVCA